MRPLRMSVCCVILSGCAIDCVSNREYDATLKTLTAIQAECGKVKEGRQLDGWGRPLLRIDDAARGTLVVSLGRDGKLARTIDDYWQSATCGAMAGVDDDMVCANGVLRRWPVIKTKDEEVYRLARECIDGPPGVVPDASSQ